MQAYFFERSFKEAINSAGIWRVYNFCKCYIGETLSCEQMMHLTHVMKSAFVSGNDFKFPEVSV